jgi:CheY-like chemotaxis protein
MIPRRHTRAAGQHAALPTGQENGNADGGVTRRATPPDWRIVLGDSRSGGPYAEKQHATTADRAPATGTAGIALTGRVALVVDDEPMILEILSELCTSLGMRIYEASDGECALRQVEICPDIEMLVTDIRMPGLDGPGLVKRALGLRPEIKVIFVTGYATFRSATWPILRKPFDLDELEDALRRALVQQGPVPE